MNLEETKKEIDTFYKQWCKSTDRGGGVLIGASIRELLLAFKTYQNEANSRHIENITGGSDKLLQG